MASRWDMLVVGAQDPARLGRWWAGVLDYQVLREAVDEVEVGPAARTYPRLLFAVAAEPKSTRNRLHIDLRPDDQAAEVERLLDMGARQVDIGQGEAPWVLLADPEGNEFRVLAAT